MVAEMRQPHALFRWASSARWLPLVEFGTVSCCRLRRALCPSLLLIDTTSPVTGASSCRPSCCLPNVLLLAASGCMIFSVAALFDSSRISVFSTCCVSAFSLGGHVGS
ncbi:hypothetical protein ACQJBY_009386 [Aegilops geniculata]